MKNTLIFTLVLTLSVFSSAPALAQTDDFTVNPDRMELEATGVTGAAASVQIEAIQVQPSSDTGSPVDGGDVSEDDFERADAPSVDLNPQPDPPSRGTETTDIGGTVRQSNESDYDFIFRAISDEDSTARAAFMKLGDIKGESTDSSATKPKEIVVVGSKVRGWDPATKEAVLGIAPQTPDDVKTDEDLAFYGARIIAETSGQPGIAEWEEIILVGGTVSVKIKQPGRFLGFIPLGLPSTLEVSQGSESEGRLKVKLPWYRLFFGGTSSEADFSTAWAEHQNAGADGQLSNIDLQNSARDQAGALETLSEITVKVERLELKKG